jgi:glycosyltransferase involved in cell wall biosynthesis
LNNNVILSISCITYNHVSFVKSCLDSILSQKINFEYEILIHDDASTDGTREIIEEYHAKYPEIIIPHYQEENQYSKGVRGFMVNYNFPRCRGKYIALCEGDDYWTDPNKLQKQVDFLETNPDYSGCYHDTLVKYTNIDKPEHLFREKLPQSMNAEDTIALFAPFHTSSFVFKKECFTFEPFLTKVKSGDMALFSIIASKGLLGKVDGVMSVYRKHEGGITNASTHKSNFNQDRIKLINYLNQFHEFKYYTKAKQVNAIRKVLIQEERRKKNKVLKLITKIKNYSNRTIRFFLKKPGIAK